MTLENTMYDPTILNDFLVVGLGSIGKRHLGNLLALGAGRVLAMDPDPARRDEVLRVFGADKVTALATLDEALARAPRAAVIATPTSRHIEPALSAARQGCHLLIEKPLSHSMDGVDLLQREASARGLVTLVGCNMRFHPGPAKVKELLDANAVGALVSVRLEAGQYLPDWHPQEDYRQMYSALKALGGGVVLDGIHEIDLARWLGGEVTTCLALTSTTSHLEIETEENAAMLFRFSCGAVGEVHLDYVQRVYSRTCHIIGDQGTIRWEYGQGVRLFSAATKQWEHWPEPEGWVPNHMYMEEMRHFLRCLAGTDKPTLDITEGARVLALAMAAKEFAEGHSAPLQTKPTGCS